MSGALPNPESVFAQMIEIDSPEKRAAFLEQACGNDPDLRREMEKLVRDHFRAGRFLESPAPHCLATIEQPSAERPGTLIGPYKLMEQIGEGGMGLVFVAEQRQPVRRKVALKIIKPGMDSRQVVARFEAERQALAMMDHPNIAKVHDGGTTPNGRPYFVMELVKGVPITQYCDDNRLKPRERLELFSHVCAAVQRAHQKGIIHRDIKPSNVLVVSHDGTPVVKVIDFGVAKAMGQQLTDKTVYTDFAQFIGTPLYMSPEQAGQSGLDVDTRTDVYALGVLLYELLTGTTPFDKDRLHKAGFDEIRRLIREEEPPKPSTRISTLGQAGTTVYAQRQSDSKQLCKLLRGELDWIVMKALEKDRNRRYESASALAADVQRYLQDEPVEACPPSRRYRLGKFLRKHRRGVLPATVLLAATVAVAGSLGWVVRDRASRQSLIEQAVEDDWKEAEIWCKQEKWAKALPALERASGRLVGSGLGSLEAKVDARRRDVAFVSGLEKARLQALNDILDSATRDRTRLDLAFGSAFTEYGLNVEALRPEESARRINAPPIRAHLVMALDDWALCKDNMPGGVGKPLRDIAQLADKDTWRMRLRELFTSKDRVALERLAEGKETLSQPAYYLGSLASLLRDEGAREADLPLRRKAQQLNPTDLWLNYELGCTLGENSATAAEAVGFIRAALVVQPESPIVYCVLGQALVKSGKQTEADEAFQKAIALKPDFFVPYIILGDDLLRQRKWPEAETAYRKAIKLYTQKKLVAAVEANPMAVKLDAKFASTYSNLGVALSEQNKLGAVVEAFQKALAAYRKAIDLGDLSYATLYNAACAAALTGADQGDAATLDAQELALLRGQALAWLRAALTATRKELENDAGKARPALEQKMRHWQQDSAFTAVRTAEALAKLPEAERREWRKVWQEVEALRQQAGGSK